MTAETGLEEREVKVSWTRLREHMECHQKAALKAKGLKSAVSDIRNYFPGTVVDVCMRRWLDREDQPPGSLAAMVDKILPEAEKDARESCDGIVRWKYPADRSEVLENCRTCLTRLEPILRELALPGRYEPAMRFRAALIIPYLDGSPQRVWLAGEMDLLTEHAPKAFRVWDLKMTANKDYWRKVTGQLLFYDRALWCMMGVFPENCGLIQPMCPEPVLWFQFTDQNRRELLASVVSYCRDVWLRDERPKADVEGCPQCEVKQACAKFAAPAASGRVPWPAVTVA